MGEVNMPSEQAIALFTNVFGYAPDPEALHAGECWQAERIDAALRRAKAEGQLVWSSEIPKVPGWYWRRYTYEQTYMEVVHVDVSGAGIVAHSNGNGSWIQTLQREGVEWAGPIALPLDARAAQIENEATK